MSVGDLYVSLRSSLTLKRLGRVTKRINALEAWARSLGDEELRQEFSALRDASQDRAKTAGFALVREAARRHLGLRLYDVQLVGGLLLAEGRLAEMRTGEGKTLTIVAPAALLALQGRGLHVVTANTYLATRDADAMGPVYAALGLRAAALWEDMPLDERRTAYAADITYGVGHEFGFDYLRDNLVQSRSERVQRGRFAAIVDEVDSLLIDEARTPMVISAMADDISALVCAVDRVTRGLKAGAHYVVNLKDHDASLTEAGYEQAEQALAASGVIESAASLYEPRNLLVARRLHSAVKAHALFKRDRHYVVENDEVVLVDEGTGRKTVGRRLEDGLHEALEAKEGVRVNSGVVPRAWVTYQNYFGGYRHLAGLTGTALTDAEEFSEMYGLETVVVPPNRPSVRKDLPDLVFISKAAKFQALVEEVSKRHATGQPVLVGCPTVRDAEAASALLARAGVPHETLTAKNVAKEAKIVACAGCLGAVTVATNMAGRGTDILLGGPRSSGTAELEGWRRENEQVVALGGLFVLGVERNGIRRVDNQLAGRAGRQGDPGQVQFLVSLEDDLFKPMAQDKRMQSALKMLGASDSSTLGGPAISALVVSAQRKVETQGFDARRHLMKTDKVLPAQRDAVYELRDALLDDSLLLDFVKQSLHERAASLVDKVWSDDFQDPEQADAAALKKAAEQELQVRAPVAGWLREASVTRQSLARAIADEATKRFDQASPAAGAVRFLVLRVLARLWSEHLMAMDELHKSLSLKPPSGLNPLHQYAKDAYEMFKSFGEALKAEVAVELMRELAPLPLLPAADRGRPSAPSLTGDQRVALEAEKRWLTRNEACPCGSALKFKRCHGRLS